MAVQSERGPTALRRRIGPYEILAEISRGGMGIVYKAREPALDRVVALKVMIAGEHASAETIERFQREAKAAAKLQHPGIVQVHAVGEDHGQRYIAMELIDGESLDQAVPRLDLTRAMEIVRDAAKAIAFAHQHGVIHRDIKPANILLTRNGHAKVADFGLARVAEGPRLTQSGLVMGTPAYMSPEQASGRIDVGISTDVYSLGALLYQVLTLKPPFEGSEAFQVVEDVRKKEPRAPRRMRPGIPRDLETICLKAMEKEPNRRYATAQDFAEEIDRFLRGETIKARPASPLYRLAKYVRRKPAVVAIVLLALAAAAAGALAIAGGGKAKSAREEGARSAAEELKERRIKAKVLFDRGISLIEIAQKTTDSKHRAKRRDLLSQAGESLTQANSIDPDYAEAYFWRGYIAEVMGRRTQAIADYSLALEKNPDYPDALFRRIMVRFVLANNHPGMMVKLDPAPLKSMREDFERLKRLDALTEKADLIAGFLAYLKLLDQGAHLFEIGAGGENNPKKRADAIFKEALGHYDRALERNPVFVEALVARGQLLFTMDPANYDRAMADLQGALRLEPNRLDTLSAIGTLHSARKEYDRVIELATTMIEISPEAWSGYHIRGTTYLLKGEAQLGWQDLDCALELNSENRDMMHVLRANLRLDPAGGGLMPGAKKIKPEELKLAMAELDSALRANPNCGSAYLCRGMIRYLHLTQAREAMEDLKKFTELEKDSPWAKAIGSMLGEPAHDEVNRMINDAYEAALRKDYAVAERLYREALQRIEKNAALAPKRKTVSYNLACIYSLTGRKNDAFGALEDALEAGFDRFDHMSNDSDLDPIRTDPRYDALLKRFNPPKH